MITQLVYHHSVRIRLKDDILEEKKGKEDKKKTDDKLSGTGTPGSVTPSTTDVESAHDDEAESATSESTITPEPTPQHEDARERTGAIVGKINNLVTMDLTNINSSYQILEIRESSPCNTLHDVIHRPIFKLLLQYRLSSLLLCYISYLAGGMCHNFCIQCFAHNHCLYPQRASGLRSHGLVDAGPHVRWAAYG